jgi:hypothetical protein
VASLKMALRPQWPGGAARGAGGRARREGAAAGRGSGSAAFSHCTTTHPLYTRFANIIGASISEATMRPNPSRALCRRPAGDAARGGRAVLPGARQGSVALPLCATAHPLHTMFAKIFGTSISEATMQPAARTLGVRGRDGGPGDAGLRPQRLPGRVRSHCRFTNRGTEYVSYSGMKWMSGGTKQQCDRALLPGLPGGRARARRPARALPRLRQGAKDTKLTFSTTTQPP